MPKEDPLRHLPQSIPFPLDKGRALEMVINTGVRDNSHVLYLDALLKSNIPIQNTVIFAYSFSLQRNKVCTRQLAFFQLKMLTGALRAVARMLCTFQARGGVVREGRLESSTTFRLPGRSCESWLRLWELGQVHVIPDRELTRKPGFLQEIKTQDGNS